MLTNYFARPFTIDRIARILSILAIIALLWWMVGSLYALLIPFVLAWVTAQLLMPVVQFVQYKMKLKFRGLSIILVLLVFLGIIVGLIALLVPSIKEEGQKALELMSYYASPELFLSILPEGMRASVEDYLNKGKYLQTMDIEQILKYLKDLFNQGWTALTGAFNFLMSFSVVIAYLIYLYFIMLDFEKINDGFMHLLPRSARPVAIEVGKNIDKYVNSYFRGQGLIALIVGVLLAIAFKAMGMPLGITLGLFVGVLNLVPYLQILGIPPMIVLCLLQSASTGQNFWILLLVAFIILGINQLIQDMILTPMIMGKHMGMRPALILLALMVWGKIGGLLGLFFGLPITMILYTLYMKYVIGEPITEMDHTKDKPLPGIKKWTTYTRKRKSVNTTSDTATDKPEP